MKVSFVHLCDYATVSKEGKLSAMGIFDRINAPSFPHQHPMLALAFQIEMMPSEVNSRFSITVKMVNADGKPQLEIQGELELTGTLPGGKTAKVPQVNAMTGVTFAKPGMYSFDIFVNGYHAGSAPFEVANAARQNPGTLELKGPQ